MSQPTSQPLNYEPRPAAARRRATRVRAGILAAAVLLGVTVVALLFHPLFPYSEYQTYFGGGIIGTPAAPVASIPDANDFNRAVYATQAGMYLLILLATQWLLLRSRGSWRLDRLGGARLTPSSAIIAGLVAMILCIGLIAALMELPDWWQVMTIQMGRDGPVHQKFGAVWIVMAIMWLAWAWAFWIYGRNLDRYTFIGKVLRGLLAGTIAELLVSAFAHAWVIRTRGSECYCTRGSYTGIVFGMTALVWLFGPGVWFFVQREKRRRERME